MTVRQVPLERLVGTKYRISSEEFGDEEYILVADKRDIESLPAGRYVAINTPLGRNLARHGVGERFCIEAGFYKTEYVIKDLQRPTPPSYPDDPEFDHLTAGEQISIYAGLLRESSGGSSRVLQIMLREHPWILGSDAFWQFFDETERDAVLFQLMEILVTGNRSYDGPYPSTVVVSCVLRFLHLKSGETVSEDITAHWTVMPEAIRYTLLVIAFIKRLAWVETESLLNRETSLPVKMLLVLAGFWQKFAWKQKVFFEFHRFLQDYIPKRARFGTAPLNLTPLLPACADPEKGLIHCERVAGLDGREVVRCRGTDCRRAYPYPLGGVFMSSRALPFRQYSLYEIFAELGISASPEIGCRPEEYVAELGAWVNRLNEGSLGLLTT